MKGRVKELSKDLHEITIELGADPATGTRRRMVRVCHGSKRSANNEMQRLLGEIQTGVYVEPSKATLERYLKEWHEIRKSMNLSPNTITNDEIYIRKHIVPVIGKLPLNRVEPLHIQKLYSVLLEKGAKGKTVLNVHGCLSKAFKQAVMWGMLKHNPCASVERPKTEKAEMRVLGHEDVDAFFRVVNESPARGPIMLAYYTGMRRGEIIALKWSDIDLRQAILYSQRGLIRTKGETITRQPKTRKSSRPIALCGDAVALLRGIERRSEYVFCRDDGRPLDPSTVSHQFQRVAKKLGMDNLRLHDLRHTHATILLQQGVHPKVVQERLGHSTISVTLDIYSHVVPSMQREAVEAFSKWQDSGRKPSLRVVVGGNPKP